MKQLLFFYRQIKQVTSFEQIKQLVEYQDGHFESLEIVNLSRNSRISESEDKFCLLIRFLRKLHRIKLLNLNNTGLTETTQVREIMQALKNADEIK